MEKYRKRFISLSLVSIGSVLFAVLVAIGIFIGRNIYTDIEKTMKQVISPFTSTSYNIRVEKPDSAPEIPTGPMGTNDGAIPPEKPDDNPEDSDTGSTGSVQPGSKGSDTDHGGSRDDGSDPPAKPDSSSGSSSKSSSSDKTDFALFEMDYEKNITAVLYSEDEGVSILSDSSDLDEETINEAVSEIISIDPDDNFGKLSDLSLYYYISGSGSGSDYHIALADTDFCTVPLIRLILALIAIFALAMVIFYFIARKISRLAVKPLEDSMEMEKQFVADVSHDLKTPITVVLANNSILKNNGNSTISEQRQWIDSTDEAAHNMLNMISEMLTLSQMESKEISIEMSKVDFSHCADKIALQMESLAFDKGINYETDIDEDIFVKGNRDYIERICSGLISNALKYEPENGNIFISLHEVKKKAVFNVRNTSVVISPEDLEHIFERFYRGDKARNVKSGHGLGLSITKKTVELMNGTIDVESTEEKGTEFTVKLDIED